MADGDRQANRKLGFPFPAEDTGQVDFETVVEVAQLGVGVDDHYTHLVVVVDQRGVRKSCDVEEGES